MSSFPVELPYLLCYSPQLESEFWSLCLVGNRVTLGMMAQAGALINSAGLGKAPDFPRSHFPHVAKEVDWMERSPHVLIGYHMANVYIKISKLTGGFSVSPWNSIKLYFALFGTLLSGP